MKQALYDIICYFRRDIVKYILLIFQYVLLFILIGNVILYIKGLEKDSELICEKNGHTYIKLVRNSFNSSMLDILNVPMGQEKMQTTLKILKNDSRFLFSSLAYDQEIMIFTKDIQKYFSSDNYDDFLAHSPYPGYYKKYSSLKPAPQLYGGEDEVISMSMCRVDEESMIHYKLTLSEGSPFVEKDYIFDIQTNQVSIILGSEYQKYFNIGDTLQLATPFHIIQATVKGFLKPSSNIANDSTYENLGDPPVTLDYSIIMPCFKKVIGVTTDEDKAFAILEYMNNLCGTLIFDQTTSQNIIKRTLKEINDYYLEQGIFTVIPLYGNNGLTYLQGEKKVAADILKILLLLLMLYNSLMLHISLNTFIEKQKYIMTIQLLNGKKLKHVIISWFFIIAFVIITSLLFAYSYDKTWIFQEISFHIWITLITILLIYINVFLLYKKMKRTDMHELLWK